MIVSFGILAFTARNPQGLASDLKLGLSLVTTPEVRGQMSEVIFRLLVEIIGTFVQLGPTWSFDMMVVVVVMVVVNIDDQGNRLNVRYDLL